MPHVNGVSRTQTTFQTSPELASRPQTHSQDVSSLARYNQKNRARESGGGIAAFFKVLVALLVSCLTLQCIFGKKKDKKETQETSVPNTSEAPPRSKPVEKKKEPVAVESERYAASKAVNTGREIARRALALYPSEVEPSLLGENWTDRLMARGEDLALLMDQCPRIEEQYGAFQVVADYYLQKADTYLKQEMEKLKQDKPNNVDGALINLLRTIQDVAGDADMLKDSHGRDLLFQGEDQLLHRKYGSTYAADIVAVKSLALLLSDYELFREATGQTAENPARWQKLQGTTLGYVDELFKEKLRVLHTKKSKAIEKNPFGKFDRLKDPSRFQPEQIHDCLKKKKDDKKA